MVKDITDMTFKDETVSDIPVIVDFWAPWCGPCKMLGPVLEDISKNLEGKAKFTKINVDENPMMANEFKVASIPTVLVIKNGKVVDEMIGFRPKPAIVQWINNQL